MIFDRLTILRAIFSERRAAGKAARRWQGARLREPRLMADLIGMGGVLAMQPRAFENGVELPVQIAPERLAYEAGRRDLALELLALMGVSPHELSSMMERNDVDID